MASQLPGVEPARGGDYRAHRHTVRTFGVDDSDVSAPDPSLLALVLLGPTLAFEAAPPVDRAALLQGELDDEVRMEREHQRCLVAEHRIRLRSEGRDFERGVWRFAQSPLDVAQDAQRCGLSARGRGTP